MMIYCMLWLIGNVIVELSVDELFLDGVYVIY